MRASPSGRVGVALLAFVLFAAPAVAEEFRVLDVRPGRGAASSNPSGFVELDGAVFFTAETESEGRELWRTEGTAESTRLVADLNPGPAGGSGWPVALGARVFFGGLWEVDRNGGRPTRVTAFDGQGRLDLLGAVPGVLTAYSWGWRLDPTTLVQGDGTAPPRVRWRTADVVSLPRRLLALGDRLIIDADDGDMRTPTRAVWSVDSTDVAGVKLWTGNWGGLVAAIGSAVLIAGEDALLVSDGTSAGTRAIAPLVAEPGGASAGGVAVFGAAQGVWRSDGTPQGTFRIADTRGWTDAFTPAGDRVFFVEVTGQRTGALWVTTGNVSGAERLADVAVPLDGPELAVRGDAAYFAAPDASGFALARADGRSAPVVLARLAAAPTAITTLPSGVWFAGSGLDGSGAEPWKSDGTPDGTRRVADVWSAESSAPRSLRVVGQAAYFLDDGRGRAPLWRTDATAAGTVPVTGTVGCPTDLVVVGDALQWLAGPVTIAGTSGSVAEIFARLPDSPFVACARAMCSRAPVAVGTHGYYFRDDGDNAGGFDAWAVDAAGASPLGDIGAGPACAMGGRLLLGSGWPAPAPLQVVDGTTATPIRFETAFDLPIDQLACGADRAFFTAGIHDVAELWVTDGTQPGTRSLRAFTAPATERGVRGLIVANGRAWFAGGDAETGAEPWVSDGTAAGTRRLADLAPGPASSRPRDFVAAGDVVYFWADDGGGEALWVSDGTACGTTRLANVRPVRPLYDLMRDEYSMTGTLTAVGRGREVVFAGADLDSGAEPWFSDGTPAGTRRLADVAPGPRSSAPSDLSVVGDVVLFAGDDAVHGRELVALLLPGGAWPPEADARAPGSAGEASPRAGCGTAGAGLLAMAGLLAALALRHRAGAR